MHMTAHRLLALTAATGALAFAAPALAQDSAPYEYAQEGGPEVIYHGDPVIQPLPVPPVTAPMAHGHSHATTIVAPPPHGYAPPHPYPTAYPHAAPPFDRGAWLANCRERIHGVSREDRGGVIGGLLGAAAGGVIGNRAWDSERLAGTLLGAGVGGLAGLAIGSAIGAAGDRKREDECAWHLDRYMAAGHQGYGYSHPGYGYGYSYGYPAIAYVPVLVAVPQRAVMRETVTEEWIDVPVHTGPRTHTKVIREHAPVPDKRIKYTKGR